MGNTGSAKKQGTKLYLLNLADNRLITVSCQLFVSHIPTGTFQIFLSNFKVAWRVQLSSPCDSTRIEIYETSTTESALKGSFCFGSIPDLVIDSSVAFIRVFSPALSIKPELTFSYTVLREANRPTFVTSTYGMLQYFDMHRII